MKRAHILHQGVSVWGVVEGDEILLPTRSFKLSFGLNW